MTDTTGIDEWLAVNVMGWEKYEHPDGTCEWCDAYTKGIYLCSLWHPFTNIEQAFQVMSKCCASGYRKKRFVVALKDVICDMRGVKNMAYRELIPLIDPAAICLAAKKAKESLK